MKKKQKTSVSITLSLFFGVRQNPIPQHIALQNWHAAQAALRRTSKNKPEQNKKETWKLKNERQQSNKNK